MHGATECAQAVAAAAALFGQGSLADLAPATLGAALAEAGLVRVDGALPSVATLLKQSGLAASLNAVGAAHRFRRRRH